MNKKLFVWIVALLLLASAVMADAIYNPDGYTNPTNIIDGNLGTFAIKDYPADGIQETEIGIYTNSKYIGEVFTKAQHTTAAGTGAIFLEGLKGSTWKTIVQLYSGSSATVSNTTHVNDYYSGLRTRINTSGTSTTHYLYEINYTAPNIEPDSIAAWYPLNDTNKASGNVTNSGNITDLVGDNNGVYSGRTFNHGAITGATWTTGQSGNALSFDGDGDYVSLGTGRPSIVSPFTISGYFKANDVTTSQYLYYSTIDNNNRVAIMVVNGEIRTGVYNGTSHLGNFRKTGLQTGTWYYFAYTWNGVATAKLYVNAVDETTSSPVISYTTVTGATIGTRTSLTGYFNGTIDEVTIYNYERTPEQIAAQYANGGIPEDNNGLVLYLPMDEGTGTVTYDQNQLVADEKTGVIDGKAMGFDGVDDYVVLDSWPTKANNKYSISGWFKTSALGKTQTIYYSTNSTNDRTHVYITAGNKLAAGTFNGSHVDSYQSDSVISASTWYHFGYIRDSGEGGLYVNGILQSGTLAAAYTTTTGVRIGNRNSGAYNFNGSISDVRIYNTSLTRQEIEYLYLEGAGENPGILNVTVTEILTGDPITNYTVKINGNIYNSTGSNTLISAPSGNYEIDINASGYAEYGDKRNVTIAENEVTSESFTLYEEQTVQFNIIDEETQNLITGTLFTVEIVGTTPYLNTSVNGTWVKGLITPATYSVRWFATGLTDYELRTKTLSVSADSYQNITLYALNTSAITSIFVRFQVYDQNLEPSSGLTLVLSKWNSDTGTYIDLSSKITDSYGLAKFQVEEQLSFYRYRVLDTDGSVLYISDVSGEQFIDDENIGYVTVPIFVNLQSDYFDNYETVEDISYTLQYTNLTSDSGYFNFVASSDGVYEYCLETQKTGFNINVIAKTCQTSQNPDISINYDADSKSVSITAVATVELSDGTIHNLAEITLDYEDAPISTNESWKTKAAFYAFVLIIVALAFTEIPSVIIIIAGVITWLFGAYQFGLLTIESGAGITIMFLAILIGGMMRRRQ